MFDSKIVLKVLNSYETKLIMQSIEEFDGETRFVGGCVRDLILKRPIYDIDLATTLLPNQIINALSFHNIKTVVTNIKYGTIVAVLKDQTFEITTLRRDTKCYGREAEVEFTNEWQTDASRRDLTINALYVDNGGNLYDYFGGVED